MTPQTLYTIHGTDDAKLARVIDEMRTLGAPTIRAVDCGDYLMALEGTHRIAAAAALGLPLDLYILDQHDMVDAASLDLDGLAEGTYTAGEIAGEVYTPSCGVYRIDDGVWR